MAEHTRTVNSGGFRIEVSPDEVSVSSANSTATQLTVFATVAMATLFYAVLFESGGSVTAYLVALAIVALGVFFSSNHNIRITQRGVDVIDVRLGRTMQTMSYSREQVRKVCFGPVAFSMYGGSNGLVFYLGEAKVKTLYGLKSIEAQILLDELERFGFAVSRDPAMAMMIEIEQSRRNSPLGRLLF